MMEIITLISFYSSQMIGIKVFKFILLFQDSIKLYFLETGGFLQKYISAGN